MTDAPGQINSDYAEVAVSVPLDQVFTYTVPAGSLLAPGQRVTVPFGRRHLVGVVTQTACFAPDVAAGVTIKPIEQVLDEQPVFSPAMQAVLKWAAAYYHHPVGEVLVGALPVLARTPQPLGDPFEKVVYRLVADDWQTSLKRAPAQMRLAEFLAGAEHGQTTDKLDHWQSGWRRTMKALIDKSLVQLERRSGLATSAAAADSIPEPGGSISLNPEQSAAVEQIVQRLGAFCCHVLNGVTGSGKTEVYFAVIDAVLARGQQALVLLPEIALTTELVARFEARFGGQVAALHSGFSDKVRYANWWRARAGKVGVVLGTRSAVFSVLPDLGLIILDEEHDASFKQQEGFRYHARSVALKRGQVEGVPVVLGSATPSLETRYNVERGKFTESRLSHRIGVAQLPEIRMIDTARLPTEEGLSQPLLRAIAKRLDARQQSLVFINRRGFAPVWYCAGCGWKAVCPRCEAPMAVHQRHNALRCHHCGGHGPLLSACPDCAGDNLIALGEGTQRVEAALAECFPNARIQRFDRDLLQSQSRLKAALDAVRNQDVDILVGTQLLTKGHDFPNVTLVGVVNADAGLYSIDYRATEGLFQQLMQVAGRAGRGDLPGQVLIQSRLPEAAFFEALLAHDYDAFARQALRERQPLAYPPFGHLALWRANSLKPGESLDFLRRVAQLGRQITAQLSYDDKLFVFDAVEAPMPKKGGRYRAQLLVKSSSRSALHRLLDAWTSAVTTHRTSRVRVSLDVDPLDLY